MPVENSIVTRQSFNEFGIQVTNMINELQILPNIEESLLHDTRIGEGNHTILERGHIRISTSKQLKISTYRHHGRTTASSLVPRFKSILLSRNLSQTQLMLTKICSFCLEIRAIKEGANDNNIVKLPESNDPNKNNHGKDYSDVEDALHCTDYKDNKYDSQIHPTEGT
jgi:hypothetical protein